MPLRAGILTLAARCCSPPRPAQAAFDVTAFELTPSSTAAGAHADVTIATSFPPYDAADPPQRPRNVVFHLPPGLAGDPFSTPRCTEADYRADACPAATKIGSVAAKATRDRSARAPGQAGRRPATSTTSSRRAPSRRGSAPCCGRSGGLLGKLFVPTVIKARATDGGLDSVVTELPTELGGHRALHASGWRSRCRAARRAGPGRSCATRPRASPATSTVEATPVRRAGDDR